MAGDGAHRAEHRTDSRVSYPAAEILAEGPHISKWLHSGRPSRCSRAWLPGSRRNSLPADNAFRIKCEPEDRSGFLQFPMRLDSDPFPMARRGEVNLARF